MRTPWWRHNTSELVVTFVAFGLLAFAGGIVFADVRAVLYVLFWTFLFIAALFRFLTPDRRVRGTVAESVYATFATNMAALVAADDRAGTHAYVPRREAQSDDVPVRLIVSLDSALDSEFIDIANPDPSFEFPNASEHRGVSLLPSGGYLFCEFESVLKDDLSESPDELAVQLAEGVSEELELADRVVPSAEPTEQRTVFEIIDSTYGPIDRFDHPVSSFLAVGLAVGLDQPVVTETTATNDGSGYFVRCRWEVGKRLDGVGRKRDTRLN